MKVYVVLTYCSNGVDVDTNGIATFLDYASAEKYAYGMGVNYKIQQTYLDLIL